MRAERMAMASRLCALLCAWSCAFTSGCGGGAPQAADYVLADGTEVSVDADGRFTVATADQTLLHGAGVIEASSYQETIRAASGFYRFIRQDELRRGVDRFLGSEQGDAGVILRYAGEGELRAEVVIDVDEAGVATRVTTTITGDPELQATSLGFSCDAEAGFMGFGAQYDTTDQRGHVFSLWSQEQGLGRTGGDPAPPFIGNAHTSYLPMPFWLDPRGFGAWVDTSARVDVDLCGTDPERARVEVEHGQALSLVLFHGPSPREVITQIGDRFGRPAAPPRWAWGPWIAIQGGRDAVLGEADALEAAGVPATALWAQDWVGRRDFGTGNVGVKYRWVADADLYPDLGGMVDTLHGRGLRFLGYANPFVPMGLDHYDEMRAMHLLALGADGEPALVSSPNGPAGMPDLTNADTRRYIEGFLAAMERDYHMDGWMVDFGEWLPTDATLSDGSDAMLEHNLYPGEWHRLSREVMDAARPDGDYALFSRSGWMGEQGVAQIVWIGDQEADFLPGDGLPTVLPAMLNLGLSGVPFVTHDIAGFSGGPSTKELYMRWTELGAFTPTMRTHEGLRRDENWNWDGDAETTAHFRRFARIHGALADELDAVAAESARTSLPMLRHLMLAFPDDLESRHISDEAMLGDTLLIAPVVEEGATERSVYLPPGTWFHVFTGERYDGGQRVTVPAPIGTPPVFSLDVDRSDLRAIE